MINREAARCWVADAFDRIGDRAFEMPWERIESIIEREHEVGIEAFHCAEVEAAHEAALVMAHRLSLRQRRNPNLTMAGMLASHSGLRCVQCYGYGNGLCASHAHMDWSVVSRLTEPMWGAELHGPWNPGVTVCPSVGNGCTHTSVVDDGATVACAL